MPELPEVETVRRHLAAALPGRRIAGVSTSGKRLRAPLQRGLAGRLRGRAFLEIRRRGKYLLAALDDGGVLVSHLGMSGRWLFFPGPPPRLPHVHARLRFEDGSLLLFQDPRRFGLLRHVAPGAPVDPALALLGPDPLAEPVDVDDLAARARGSRTAVKNFLLDQRRLAGIGNIYASEILHGVGLDPRLPAGRLTTTEWAGVVRETVRVFEEAVSRMGTTFSTYRTVWNEPGSYGEQLRVYDRAGEPCRACGGTIRRIVQGQRSTFFCPRCQPRRRGLSGKSKPSARV